MTPAGIVEGVTPVYSPVNPYFIDDGDIPIGWTYDLHYNLEAGKKYHVFLVGDWVESNLSRTDYDIFTYLPSNYNQKYTIHTEASALPEQVANDPPHQYFVPPETGKYRFRIHNDPEDSQGSKAAVFMVIEHIEANKRYSRYLVGRSKPTDPYDPEKNSWAYEFSTAAREFQVFVSVPDTLDMYEVRLYPMANPDSGIGYNMRGVGTPSGDLLSGTVVGGYGGYNTKIEGYRAPEGIASCEFSGQDMMIGYSFSGGGNTTKEGTPIFYYLVLIAEYDYGEVEFYIKTDFSEPEVTLLKPVDRVYAGERTPVEVSVSHTRPLRNVWIEYTTDGWETKQRVDLEASGDLFVGEMPAIDTVGLLNCTVYAEDELDNVGSESAGFVVKNRAKIRCDVIGGYIEAGDKAKVSGITNIADAEILLEFKKGGYRETVRVKTDGEGRYEGEYLPKQLGDWTVQASFEGDEVTFEGQSEPDTFVVQPVERSVTCLLSPTQGKKDRPVQIYGKVRPEAAGILVEILFSSSTSYETVTVRTDPDGSYSASYTFTETGVWDVMAKVTADWRYAVSTSELKQIRVVPPTPIDMLVGVAVMAVTPPYLYMTVSAAGIGSASVVLMKRDAIRSRLARSKGSEPEAAAKEAEDDKKVRQRYRRRENK